MLYSLRHMGVESLGLFDGVLRYSHVTNSGIVHLFSHTHTHTHTHTHARARAHTHTHT